jgi:hypothetical protein
MLRYLYRRSQLKGLMGGSRAWTGVWALLFAVRMFKKASSRDAKVVYTEVLHPGETVVIRHEDAAPKRKRR